MTDTAGIDVNIDDDLDPTGRDATEAELVAADIVHRLTTDKIDLIDAPNGVVDFGINVRKWAGDATTRDDVAGKSPLIDEVLHRIEGIAWTRIGVDIANGETFDDGGAVDLLIAIAYGLTTGETFSRTLGVSSLTVAFLSQGT